MLCIQNVICIGVIQLSGSRGNMDKIITNATIARTAILGADCYDIDKLLNAYYYDKIEYKKCANKYIKGVVENVQYYE